MEHVAIVARLKEGSQPRAAELIAHGPPFDLAEAGIFRHSVYLSAREVVFVFEGYDIDSPLSDIVDLRPHPVDSAFDQWRPIVDGTPRIARERFAWERSDIETPRARW